MSAFDSPEPVSAVSVQARRPDDWIVVALAAAIVLFSASRTVADPDLWWHLRVGNDILDTGDVTGDDTYSYLSGDVPWMNHEWLAESLFAAVWRAGGEPALVLLKMAVAMAVAWLVGRRLWRSGVSLLAASLVTVTGVIGMLPTLGSVRPQIFTILLVVVVLLLLDRPIAAGARARWWIPALVALWINLHGGVILGVALVGLWLLVEMLAARRIDVTSGLLLAATGAALVCNPYGETLPRFIASASLPRPELSEWAPLALGWFDGGFYVAALLVALVARFARPVHPGWPATVCLAALALLPLVARRHTSLLRCRRAGGGGAGGGARNGRGCRPPLAFDRRPIRDEEALASRDSLGHGD